MQTIKINNVITPVNTKYGAPMGRPNVGSEPVPVTRGNNGRICKVDQIKVYDRRVILCEGYDNGGAYWGIGPELRVRFTKDLSFMEFYRNELENPSFRF